MAKIKRRAIFAKDLLQHNIEAVVPPMRDKARAGGRRGRGRRRLLRPLRVAALALLVWFLLGYLRAQSSSGGGLGVPPPSTPVSVVEAGESPPDSAAKGTSSRPVAGADPSDDRRRRERESERLKTYKELQLMRQVVGTTMSKSRLRTYRNWTALPVRELSKMHEAFTRRDYVEDHWYDSHRDRPGPPPPGAAAIPRKLHFTWKTSELRDLPDLFRTIQLKWKYLNPGWEIKIWTDEECDELVRTKYPEYYEFYSGLEVTAERSDVFRYLLLHQHGGFYADMDMEPLQPMDGLVAKIGSPQCVAGLEPEVHAVLAYNKYHVIGNAFLGSVPGHPLWEAFLPECMRRHEADTSANDLKDATSITGPIALDDFVQGSPKLTRNCALLKPEVTAPAYDLKQRAFERCERVLRKHHPHLMIKPGEELPEPYKVTLCKKVSTQGDSNVDYPPTSFMVHHWAHTWRGVIDASAAGGAPAEERVQSTSNIGKEVVVDAEAMAHHSFRSFERMAHSPPAPRGGEDEGVT